MRLVIEFLELLVFRQLPQLVLEPQRRRSSSPFLKGLRGAAVEVKDAATSLWVKPRAIRSFSCGALFGALFAGALGRSRAVARGSRCCAGRTRADAPLEPSGTPPRTSAP